MSTAVAPEKATETCGLGLKDTPPAAPPLTVTEKASRLLGK